MKVSLIVILVVLVGLLGGVGQASIGSALPPEPGMLVLIGAGMVGIAVWGRRKFKRQ